MALICQKHLIQCRCLLPQFKSSKSPVFHKFIVFSVLDDDVFKEKHVQCPNCGIIHRVTDICTSIVIEGKESSNAIMTIDDIKDSLPDRLKSILETNNAELYAYEHASFILEQKLWGDCVVLSSEHEGNQKNIKVVRILGETLFKVFVETINEVF